MNKRLYWYLKEKVRFKVSASYMYKGYKLSCKENDDIVLYHWLIYACLSIGDTTVLAKQYLQHLEFAWLSYTIYSCIELHQHASIVFLGTKLGAYMIMSVISWCTIKVCLWCYVDRWLPFTSQHPSPIGSVFIQWRMTSTTGASSRSLNPVKFYTLQKLLVFKTYK